MAHRFATPFTSCTSIPDSFTKCHNTRIKEDEIEVIQATSMQPACSKHAPCVQPAPSKGLTQFEPNFMTKTQDLVPILVRCIIVEQINPEFRCPDRHSVLIPLENLTEGEGI